QLRPGTDIPTGMPPIGETRFLSHELLLRLNTTSLGPDINALLQRLGITVISLEPLPSLGGSLARPQLPPGMTVRRAIAQLEAYKFVPQVATNSIYKFAQSSAAGAAGDPAQYMVSKFELQKVHKMATGRGVVVAVIDSEVDRKHTELKDAISEELDTLAKKEPPHS